jgi:hypothetical protein
MPWRGNYGERLPAALIESGRRVLTVGELLDKLNALDDRRPAEPVNPLDQAAAIFRSASQRVDEAIEAIQEPGMPLDRLSNWTRQAPLQALAAAFLVGVLVTRRRR